ncbi:FMN-binding glutamate synthase family protein [Sphingomicrobium astaxanthinifaciens]|uniref:FMN-binding glutamate synthase family protein n=1 Tax=Sphingomicrobium astaxanthinifaciens TaxID=1227949 RepID=UPI001FCABAB9|nr:FMN-binding glutamate synthase family protein [Sphingomicrobium astaxanthinifaciens]MCJ7422410.1 FMN-binding glutamate synthase family protein [Sphingomicrobium astaxanthinifaciens]
MTHILETLALVFIWCLGLGVVAIAVMFVIDVSQTSDAVRRNYPVIGRFRHLFGRLGEFFRQYFFAMDREEMPFNRAQRDWVKRAAAGQGNVRPFGSTKNLQPVGTPIFVNAAWPTLGEDAAEAAPLVIGPGARRPYAAPSFFNMSSMSYGSLSKPAVRALSLGTARAGCWMSTGEGGLAPAHLEGGGDIVFQLGTAKYGARRPDGRLDEDKLRAIAAHDQVRMIELKLAQGAKPGKGGILPAGKITAEIAAIRGIPEDEDSISPNRHPEIANDDELLDFIDRLRRVSGLPVGIKTVLGDDDWLDGFFARVCERGKACAPDFITIDGGDGGTGAAPMPLMDNVGMVIHEALPLAVDLRARHGLEERIRLVVSGKLVTPSDTAWALATGADFVNAARGFMFAIGCIQAMKCHTNNCPTGVTTHKKRLQRGLVPEDKADKVANFVGQMREEVGIIAHSCGVASPRDLQRCHVRLVCPDGRTRRMDEMHPDPVRQT